MLTILSGEFKGRKLSCPKSGTRPTSSLVKKALFDTIRQDLESAVFCDLFAGSGAMGLEAISQGASLAYLVEAMKAPFMCIKANVELLKCAACCKMHLKKAHKFLQTHIEDCALIDIFFLDPPYDIPESDPSSYESLLEFFNKIDLKKGCLIICETKDPLRIEKPLENLEALSIISKKKYGDSFLFFIKKS